MVTKVPGSGTIKKIETPSKMLPVRLFLKEVAAIKLYPNPV